MDFSFNKEKVQKECYKLVGISNLGAKTMEGYMLNRKYNPCGKHSEFSITEMKFLYKIALLLVSPYKEWGKAFLDYTFKGKEKPDGSVSLSMSHLCEGAPNRKVSLFDFYDFCAEGINKYLPYLESEDDDEIIDSLLKANLPLIAVRNPCGLSRSFAAAFVADYLYCSSLGCPITEALLYKQKVDRSATLLCEIIYQSPFMEAIMRKLGLVIIYALNTCG